MARWKTCWGLLLMWLLVLSPALVQGQVIIIHPPHPPHPPRPIPIPPPFPRPTPIPVEYRIRTVEVNAQVRDQMAKVSLSQVFQNTGSGTIEAQLVFPMPEDAAISGLTLLVDGKELTGKLMKKEEARRIYEEIVRRRQDPALLEYMGQGMFQTSVFPIPAQAERTVQISYSQLLKKDNGLIDLVLPLGTTKHGNKPLESLNATIRVEASDQIKAIYSPTHQVEIQRPDNTHAVVKLALKNVAAPDDFRLLYSTAQGLVGMNLISYKPSDSDEGYFLLLASPDVQKDPKLKIDRTVVFVFDRSGSMSGKKIEQAREALKFLINQLQPNDTFNIVAYDSNIEAFKPELQRADEATIKAALSFAEGLYPGGGTNIDGALQTALKMLQDPKRPSYVLFLTDGIPTVGELQELKIAGNAKAANKVGARTFCFGVGFDVNARLLDRIARDQRGQSVYVRPNENIEVSVSALYNKIGSPLLTDLQVAFEFDKPAALGAPVSRIYPKNVVDLFHGEQLVMVGRYRHAGPAKISLSGNVGGEKKTFTFPATFVEKSNDETHGYVEKLWATRRIGEIIDELDLRGQNKELIDELVQLSLKHGIITPYTSFLADENVRLADRTEHLRRAGEATLALDKADGRSGVEQRAFKGNLQNADNAAVAKTAPARSPSATGIPADRSGAGGQTGRPAASGAPASRNTGIVVQDVEGKEREVYTVRNLGQKTFYRRNNQWQDSTVKDDQIQNATRVKQFSKEYFELANTQSGKLAKYLVFDEPVILNLDGKIYQIDPPDPATTEKGS